MKPKRIPITAPLLFWLALVCGLAGMTVLRFDGEKTSALWAGTIGGAAIGHALAHFRIRAWLIVVGLAVGGWFFIAPAALAVDGIFGTAAETFIQSVIPAAICGYLALGERTALLAFWYPTVLFMVVILDGALPGAFDLRASAPFTIGLALLFVSFLRARATRQAEIWRTQGNTKIAAASPRTVLRGSPVRTAAAHAWTATVTIASLALASWVAPQLWQKEKSMEHARAFAAAGNAATRPYRGSAALPCCEMRQRRERVKEYFEVDGTGLSDITPSGCRACVQYTGTATGEDEWTYAGSPGSGLGGGVFSSATTDGAYGYGGTAYSSYTTPTPTTTTLDPLPPPDVTQPIATSPPLPTTPPKPDTTAPQPDKRPAESTASASSPAAPATLDTPTVTPVDPGQTTFSFGAPWRSMLAFSLTVWLTWLAGRALRRAVTLRHLARPFWNEPADQRISNHWQRVLLALSDAGLAPGRDEPPSAFARRVGIAELETCATILDRVRHGVRIDDEDLASMNDAASAVIRQARVRAGTLRRAAAWLRAPAT